jgi:hypothetical protein
MTGPEHYREAEFLNKRAYHYIYGDGADVQVGLGFAAMAQVHATLALTAGTIDSYHKDAAPADWTGVLS